MAKSHKKKKRRTSGKKKSKLMKNVVERKFRRGQKKFSKFLKLFISGVPDSLALENCSLLAAEQQKQNLEDLLEVQKECRLNEQIGNNNIEDLIDEATQKVENFNICHSHVTDNFIFNRKSNCMQFKEVVDAADVILEVLDARDPLGSRCPQVEQLVLNTNKILLLVLNKIDLIPKNNLFEWLKYLRQEVPTVAFKSSIETQNGHITHSKNATVYMKDSLLSSYCCVGASLLINLLEKYCRNRNMQTLIKVGVVGFPNVGKSSVIKSLKQFYSCSTSKAIDITNAIKSLSLDKQFEILDNSGIVYAKDDSSVTLALRNAVKVENLKDVISPAEAIVERVDHMKLCLHYCIPQFSSCHELLCSLGVKMGKFTETGNPDFEGGARMLINDWNSGKIKYYTHPPVNFKQSKYISAEYTAHVSKIFDISLENEQMELDKAPLLFPVISIAAKSSEPTEGLLEELETNNYALTRVITELDTNKENATKVEKQSNELLTEYHLQKLFKKRHKKVKHKRLKNKEKKFHKLALALSESVDASLIFE